MNKINIKRLIYHARHNYITMENVVIAVALIIGAGWAWGSVSMMQRNYELQKVVDAKQRTMELYTLRVQLLKYEQAYYSSDEYRELAARKNLGLVQPGEKVLVLPPNSEQARRADVAATVDAPVAGNGEKPSNMSAWVNFLFGGSRSQLQK